MVKASNNPLNWPEGLKEVDQVVLEHLLLHHLSLKEVILRRIFSAASPTDMDRKTLDSCIRRLKERGFLASVARSLDGYSYYTATRSGASSVSVETGESLEYDSNGHLVVKSLHRDLAFLWACCGPTTRHVVPPRFLVSVLGKQLPRQVMHCVLPASDGGDPTLYRAYAPGPETDVAHVLERIRSVRNKLDSDVTKSWALHGAYRVLVLVSTRGRRDQIQAALERSQDDSLMMADVDLAPDVNTLRSFVESLSTRESGESHA